MNDSTAIFMALLAASNIVLVAYVVIPSILRQRRDRRFADSLRPVGSDGSPSERIYSPATPLVDDGPASPRTDTLTGLLLPSEWERIIADEGARIRRYGRTATVVLIELDGLDRLVGALGQGAGNRLIMAVADTLSRHERSADQLARLDVGRFGILLAETGEVEAVNYVERVRAACDLWLAAGAIALKLAIGWAAPPTDGTLDDAMAMAEKRILVERERNKVSVTPAPTPATQTTTDLAPRPSLA